MEPRYLAMAGTEEPFLSLRARMAAFTMSSYLGWAGAALGGIFACWFVSTAHRGMQVPREQSD